MSGNRVVAIAVALVLTLSVALPPPALAGDNEQYIEAYNTLVRMLVSRCKVAGVAYSDLQEKNSGAQTTVTGAEVNHLRARAGTLLNYFIDDSAAQRGVWTVDTAFQAFPTLMTAEGPAFRVIPGDYTDSGQPVESHTFQGN